MKLGAVIIVLLTLIIGLNANLLLRIWGAREFFAVKVVYQLM
jgi:hypothetical protein